MKYDALVVGAGVNGLAAAACLARAGWRVAVLEQQEVVGGVCRSLEFHPGFRANACVDDPGWMPTALSQELGLAARGYAPTWTRAGTVFPGPDGEAVILSGQAGASAAALRGYAPADAQRWEAFSAQVADLSGILEMLYASPTPLPAPPALGELTTLLSFGRRVRALGRRGMVDLLRTMPMSVADWLDDWFESPALKGALSTWGVRDIQHGPMSGGTALMFLHQHVGMPRGLVGGRRIVPGGVGQLAEALATVARAAGAEVRLGAEVVQIVTRDARVSGVVLISGEQLEAPVVLSSADVRRTVGHLLEPGLFDPAFLEAVDHVRMRSPVVRMHLALDGLPDAGGRRGWTDEALGGTITLAADVPTVERAYDAAKHGGQAEGPVLQVTIPSLHDRSLAPAGQHVMTVHAQFAAARLAGGWTREQRVRAAEAIVRRLETWSPGISNRFLQLSALVPADVERDYLVTEGSVLHGELALDQFLFMRPVPGWARHATPLPGLWFCGSSTHPGAGTAAASGWLAARAVLAKHKRPKEAP